VQYHRRN